MIPCYNERETIKEVILAVQAMAYPEIEVIVVDDSSHDGTQQVLTALQAELAFQLIFHPQNQGKGAALRTGFQAASGEIVAIQDADLEYDPSEIPTLIQPILEGKADVVYGSRFMGGRPHRVLYFWHMVGNRILTLLSNAFTNLTLTDMETCYKAFRKEVLQQFELKENRFGFEPEITAKVAQLGCRIYEVGISYSGRTYQEGKKITWRDGFSAIRCILKYNIWSKIPNQGLLQGPDGFRPTEFPSEPDHR
ncbi:MAG: glycosyl transferase [Candidatus Melainabacteria bacterium HGW-Melainabacteria-1]|nr:MAG: glycosyl transferase [Candidatus Melainabacteria bacterium HGW-Melainabacteria-1]